MSIVLSSAAAIANANNIVFLVSIGACFWSLVVGVAIRWSGRFKWIALYFGIPVTILGVALMIKFRQPDVDIGYIGRSTECSNS